MSAGDTFLTDTPGRPPRLATLTAPAGSYRAVWVPVRARGRCSQVRAARRVASRSRRVARAGSGAASVIAAVTRERGQAER